MHPASYTAAHRYDRAAVQYQHTDAPVACTLQPRDVAIVRDVWRYKFLSAPQLCELWWPGRLQRAGQRRLLKLFEAGHLDRFRPITRRGSFAWTYQLAPEGHRLLQSAGVIDAAERFNRRRVYDYGYVLHELQLNAWVLAYRRAAGTELISWEGETPIQPPASLRRAQLRLDGDWSIEGLRDPRARPLRPDAVLEVDRDDGGEGRRTFLIEYDRTRRVDKNYEKFRRYDAFLCWWWAHSSYADAPEAPFVVFVCQDADQRAQFLAAGDRELTGLRWHPSASPDRLEHPGRRRTLFAVEVDAHTGALEALRLPAHPPGHPRRAGEPRRVRLPGGRRPDSHHAQLALPGTAET